MKLNISVIILILLFCFAKDSIAQNNIFDRKHSLEFAQYLLKSKQYRNASVELERLVYFDDNDSLKAKLLSSYRLDGNRDKGIVRANQMYPDLSLMKNNVGKEYVKLLLSKRMFNDVEIFFKINKQIDKKNKLRFNVESALLSANWQKANKLIYNKKDTFEFLNKYTEIIDEANAFKPKKEWLAGILSAVVPGSGKVYTTYWQDGLFTFAGISISTWQAYDGFNTNGIKSVYGWIFGGVAAVLYFSNIYGAVKSARKYNLDNEKKLIHKAELIMGNY